METEAPPVRCGVLPVGLDCVTVTPLILNT